MTTLQQHTDPISRLLYISLHDNPSTTHWPYPHWCSVSLHDNPSTIHWPYIHIDALFSAWQPFIQHWPHTQTYALCSCMTILQQHWPRIQTYALLPCMTILQLQLTDPYPYWCCHFSMTILQQYIDHISTLMFCFLAWQSFSTTLITHPHWRYVSCETNLQPQEHHRPKSAPLQTLCPSKTNLPTKHCLLSRTAVILFVKDKLC